MRWTWTLALVAAAASAAAGAADKLAIGPVPGWVQPHAVPAQAATVAAHQRGVYRDGQVRFDTDGGVTTYWETVSRAATPESLAPIGNIVLTWNPDTDALTLHRLHIIRAGQVINVLATQGFATLRREQNLERASVDGRLTATLQIAGLQVGDLVDLAATIRRLDPALGGHGEEFYTLFPDTAAQRMAVQWRQGRPVRWRAFANVPAPTPTHAGGVAALTLETANLAEPVLPRDAPARYRVADLVQFSDWRSWAELSALMAPLYTRASVLTPGGAAAAQAARIAAATPDPVAQAEAALRLVQEQVRYLYVGLNDGGYLPAAADETWARRFGDCKGKTALLLGLLHALGIEAQPVLVNSSGGGDAIPAHLPAAGLFDHVLVRATVAGRTYWLDGTKIGDQRLAVVETPAFHWGLPIQSQGAALVPIMPAVQTRPFNAVTLRLNAAAGVDRPVPAHADMVVRGDQAQVLRRQLAGLTPDARDRRLRDIWRQTFDFIEPARVVASYDAAAGEATLSLDGDAKLDWAGDALELPALELGYSVNYTREPGPNSDAPFAVPFPYDQVQRIRLTLPDRGQGYTLDAAAFDQVIAGLRWRRMGQIENGVVVLERELAAVAPEFPAAQAAPAQELLRRLSHQHLYLHRPHPAG